MAVTNNFSASTLDLNGQVGLSQPTALVWGPDGRLYITEVDGDVKVLTIAFGDKNPADADPTAQFYVTDAVTVDLIKGAIQNHNDDGTENGGANRQVTGIDVTAQYDAGGVLMTLPDGTPMVTMYVTSSDSRIGAGGDGNDSNLDTNSGVITMMTQTGPNSWTAIDIVRGLPRSEENHATNGLEVIQEFAADGVTLVSERMIVASGGNTNTGAPSNNFAGQEEQPLSAAILEIDLTMLKGMPVLNDDGRAYIYDLPTLNDPSRPDDINGVEANDPFGGNDSKNSAKLTEGGPVSIYSPGYRNAYDVEVTEDGRVWTYDNGANNSWGGRPIGEAGDNGNNIDIAQALGYIATNLNNGEGNSNDDINLVNWNPSNKDNFHEITRSDDLDGRTLSAGQGGAQTFEHDGQTYVYGGHPNPIRAEGSRAGLLFSPDAGTDNAYLLVSNQDSFGNGGGSDYAEVIAWLTEVENNNAAFPSSGIYGADTGDLTKKVLAVTPGVLYDIYSFTDGSGAAVEAGASPNLNPPSGGTFQGQSGLPADIAEVVAYKNPIEGDYREAGKTDGALDTGNGSINGLAEYTSTILDEGDTKMSGAILATVLGGGTIIVMGRNADGSMSSVVTGGFATAADRTTLAAGGGPLGITTVGDDYIDRGLTQPFQGSIWTAVYQQNGPLIEIFQPDNGKVPLAGSEIVNLTDRDLDGVDHVADPFEFSDENGYAIAPGETIVLDFNPSNTNFPTSLSSTGLLGAALDGTTPNRDAQTVFENFTGDQVLDGLYDIGGNVLPGGNAPILQIKKVIAGSVVGAANSARDVMQTGIRPSDDTDRIVATMNVKNWIPAAGGVAPGQLTGMIFGDGTQANFLRIVFGSVNGVAGIEVGYEIGDAGYATLAQVAVPGLSDVSIDTVDLRLTIDMENGFAVGAEYRLQGQADFTALNLNGFTLPAGVLQDVLTGNHTIGTGAAQQASGAAIGFLAETSAGNDLEAIDFNNLEIEAFGNEILADTAAEVGLPGSVNTDTVIYTGTDTALAALAPNVENFDGTGSAADFVLTANDLDNLIRVGSGTNTVTTGAGADSVRGTLADLDGDVITDFSTDDAVLIEGATLTNLGTPVFGGAAGSATITLGGTTITLSGPDLADYDPADGGASINITQDADGVRITLEPALSPVIAISAGGADLLGATVRDQSVDFLSDAAGGGAAQFLTGVTSKSYTNATIAGTDIPDTDLDLIHQTERSAVDTGKWGYAIPVEDGNYLVDLYFAEIFHGVAGGTNGPGSRLFDIFIEDDTVETGVDVLTEAGGPAQELVKTYQATVTDGVLNIEFDATVDQAKLSGLVVWKVGGTFTPPPDSIAPEIVSIEVPNPSSVQDGARQVIVTLTDETGFDAADFAGLTGDDLSFTGIVPDAVSAPVVVLSDGDKTATLTYTLSRTDNSWPNGVGEVTIAAGAYDDAAGNSTQAASAGFVLEPNLDNLERGVVVRAINIGTASQAPGTLGPDPLDGNVVDNNRYGGALTDTIITDAFGNFVTFEADSDAFHTSPKPNQFANVDGQSGTTGSNAGGIDLDGSAYHTYRDSAAGSWTSTFTGFANGSYIVELHFAELFAATQATARVGDFTVNGVVFGDDYNAFASAEGGPGADKPSFIRKAVTVTDGTIQVLVDDVSVGQPAYSAIVVYDAVNPSSPPALSIGDVTVAEGDLAEITILRSGNLAEATTVDVALSLDGTADAGDVGTLSASSVTFAAGEASKTLTLTIIDDETEEGAETLTVTLSNPTGNATLADASATVTIAASDSDVQAPVGTTIFELDFEGASREAISAEDFDGTLGDETFTLDVATSQITGGKLVVQTAEGDINDGDNGNNASVNDFTRTVDLSDPALTEIYLTTRFDNPFDQAFFTANGLTGTFVPNYAQQGIVIGTGTQLAGEMVKLVWGGVAGGADTGVQIWTKGSGADGLDQKVTLGTMAPGVALFDVASVELTMRIDKAAGTVAQFVTLFDASGAVLGGSRPDAAPGFATAVPVALTAQVLNNITSDTAPTHVGVHSSDNSSPAANVGSFEATWDFLRLSSPQFVEPGGGDALVSVAGTDVVENGDADTTDLTFTLTADDGYTGILSVTLSIDTGAGPVESTQDVTFAAGVGSVTVPVANDTRWNGTESVTVEIVSVETDGYARNPSAAAATAGVTEDDLADSFGGAEIGDFSDDRLDPTDVPTLTLGETVLVATQQGDSQPGGRDRDYITFEVPEGQELTGLFLDGYVTTESTGQAFMGLQAGPAITVNPLTGQPDGDEGLDAGIVYSGGNLNGNLLAILSENDPVNAQNQTFEGIPEKLPAGIYTLWLNQGGEPTTVTLRLVSEAATGPAPDVTLSIADAPTLVEAGDSGTTDLAFALTATGDFTGEMDLEFTQGGTPSSATVTFTDGAGVLTIPVANDDADTGDTTVSITLTGATSAADAIAISTDAASATGTVTEDDNMPIFERGDVVAAFNAGGPALTFDGIDFAAALSGTDGAPFAGGAQFTDNNGGNGVQDVYTGTIYQTEINDGGNDGTPGSFIFSTSAGIDPTKSYFVDLYLAEIYTDVASTGPGTGRVFSVFAEDGAEPVLADFDVVAETGNADIPVVVQLAAPISPGANGAIDLSFIAAVDRAKVSAIVIREAVMVDPTAVAVSVADVTVSEEAGFADIVFTREGNTDADMTITFSTADGGATAGADYTAATAGTVTILAGETSATAQVALTGDDLEEGDETFTVTIDSAAADGATVTVTRPAATVTLTDDDAVDPLDIDGDGIANTDDPFAYDGTNGGARALVAGGEFTQDFDTATTDPFDAAGGFSGILVNPAFDYGNPADPAADPYGNRTSGAPGVEIAGGTLNVTSTETDAFNTGIGANNTLADGYQSAVDVTGVNSFEVHARASSADWLSATSANGFAQFGISLGAGSVDDFVKLVIGDGGNSAPRVQIAHNNSLVGGEFNYAVGAADGPSVDLAQVGDFEFRLIVDKAAGTVIGQVDFFAAADGALLTSFTTPPATILADSSLVAAMNGANPLTGGDGGLAYGIFVSDWSAGDTNRITASYDFLTIRALDAVPAALVSISDAPSAVEAGDEGVTTLLFDLAYTGGSNETRLVSYTVDGGDEQSASVTFTDGAATLAVDVTNDVLADGDDAVTVVLTGIGDNVADMVDPAGSSATGTVTEDDFAPVAVADAPSTPQNTPITFDPAANDTDADLGDGALVVTAIDITGTTGGTVTLLDGVVTVTPDTGFTGDISFGYTITDPAGNSAEGTAAVTVEAPPVTGDPIRIEAEDFSSSVVYAPQTVGSASGDEVIFLPRNGATGSATYDLATKGVAPGTYNVEVVYYDENDGVSVVGLTLDGEPIGSITFDENTPSSAASALNIRSQTFFGVTVGAAGVLVLDGMSDAGEFARIDYIEFTPVEGGVDENTAPFAPFDLPDASRVQNADFDFDAGALFADAEEDALSFAATTTTADGGVLVGNLPEGVTFDTATGVFGGAPSAPGSYEITVTASDGSLPSTPETFTLTVLESNDAPVLDALIADQTVRAGDPVNFNVAGSFSDPDSDDLIYAVAGDLPPGVTFDAATGLFSGTVAVSAPARSYEVTVTATDVTGSNTGVSDTFLFNVTGGGVDTRPTVRIEAEDGTLVDGFFTEKGERIRLLAEDDGTATYDLSEIAPGAYQIRIGYFDENDGESTLGVAVSSDAGTPFSGGFTLDEATTSAVASQSRNFREKTLDGTLTLGGNGLLTLTGQADAGEFLRVDWIELIPVGGGGGTGNFAPSEAGAGIPDATVQGLDAISIDTAAAFADPEEDALTYAKVSGPDWVSVDPATGEITGTPPAGGVYAITVSAEDAANNPGILATSNFTLTVEVPDNVAPTADAIILGAVDETAAPVSIDLLADANAADGDGDTLAVDPISVTVLDQGGNPVSFTLDGATLSIDPAQFAALDAGESATVTVGYDIIDGRGGVTPNTATLSVDGVDDASAPTVSIAGTPTALESGDDGTQTTLLFDLAYTGGANETRDVTYTVNGDARTATVTFLDGVGSLAVSVDNDDLANGTDSVTVVLTGIGDNVTDMVDIAARTATGTVSEDDFAPVAVADTASTVQGAPVTFDPAANDTDADGGPLTVTAIDTAATAGGTVVLNGDGTVTVTPLAGFTGQIAFGYTVADSAGNQNAAGSAAVTVTGGVDTRPTVRIEAETGTLSGGLSVESDRIRTTSDGEATYDLGGVAAGDYSVRIGYWDENDGASSVGVTMSSASAGTFSDTLALDEATLSGRFSSKNFRETTLDGTFTLGANGQLTLTAQAQGSEIVRIDYIELIPTGAPPAGNAAPTAVTLTPVIAGIAEDTLAATKVADIAVTDDGQGANTFALTGEDAGLFEIVGNELFLKAGQTLDAIANPTLDVAVTVNDVSVGADPDAVSALLSIPVSEADAPPSVSVGVGSSTIEGDPAAATLTLSETSDQPITVTLVLSSGLRSDPATIGTAAGGGDLAFNAAGLATLDVTIPAGSLSVDVPFSIFQDDLDEADFETYEIAITAANVGGSIDGAAEQVAFNPTPAEGGVLDDDAPVTADDLAPDGDLDGDGTANSADDDVDGDGILNVDDAFAYDAGNGMTLVAGETKTFDFDTDGTIYQNGMTGFLQGTATAGFNEDTGAATVSGGFLTVDPVTAGDTGGTNNPQDDAVVGVKNGSFTAKALVVNPWFGPATNPNSFDQLGLVLGLDSDDMIKLVFGQSAGVVEFQKQETTGTTTTATKYGGSGPNANVPLPAGVTLDTFAKAEIVFEVVSTGPATATVTGSVNFLDAAGAVIATGLYGMAPIGGALAAALADPAIGVGVGFTHVNGGGDPGFIARLDSLTITEGDGSVPSVDTDAPTAAITLTNPVDAAAPLLVSVTLDDASGIDTTTLGADDLALAVSGIPAILPVTFDGFADGVASYSIAAPTGGWTGGLPVTVTLKAGEVADLAATPNTNAATSQGLTLDIGGGTGGGEDEVVFRINAGGNLVAATDGGPNWVADSIANPNVYLAVTDNRNDTGGTAVSTFDGVPSAVFAEARSSDFAFSYDVPTSVLENGENYEVRLYFAEIFGTAQAGGFRNFDATVEGFVPAAFNNIDPGALFGGNAGVLTTQVKVTDGTLNIGFTQDVAQNPIISAIEIVKLSTDVENPEPPVDPGNALEAFDAQTDIVKNATYGTGVTGSAVLEIMTGDNNIQASNFGSNSFEVTNTGGKKISAIFIDVSSALYQDSVFDPDGKGGDNAAKAWAVNSAGDTGAFVSGNGYFLPGVDPIPNTTGTGGVSNGGFKGAMVKFNASVSGGFGNGETVGFSGDMDPNSIAGLTKASVDGSAILSWDVGGISGHELIGSLFTVLFDDGTTASGQLASDGSASGSHALATQGAAPAAAPGIAVNGFQPGQNGTYGGTLPTVTVTGNPGDKVQITMTKGFNPVTETSNGIADLVEGRLERYDFKANNVFDAQTKIVTIGADGTFDASTLFDYDDAINNNVGSGSFAGDDVAQIGFVATKVQNGGAQLPIGPTTAPIYLSNVGGPVTGDPTGGTGGDGYFEIIGSGSNARFKIQIEDENANGGTNPPGNWTHVDGDGADGKQSGTQGGHYYWGSEADSVGLNAPQANSFLNYEIFIPDGEEGVYNLRVRASRDTGEPSDQRNDVWVRIDDDAEALQVNPTNSVSSNGFVKVFGGGTNSWGFAGSIDSVLEEDPNFSATFNLDAGLHTITLAGRSQGFHIDFFELYKGGAPSTNASNSTFIEGEPGDGGGTGGGGTGSGGELRKAIVAGSDDTDQNADAGTVNLTKADMELGDGGRDIGLRFTDLDLESLKGVDILDAYIEFTARSGSSGTINATVKLENSLNPATFSAANGPTDRTDTFIFTEDWTDSSVPTTGSTFRTDDLSDMIEAFVALRDGELSNSDDLAFIIEDVSGVRKALSFEGGEAPELVLIFQEDTILG